MDRFVKKRKRDTVAKDDGTTNETAGSSKIRKTGENINPGSDVTESLKWKQISSENLNCRYTVLYSRSEADNLISECEGSLNYHSGPMAQVHVFGKWRDLPRKQTAYGDDGLTYTYSGKTVAASPWTPLLKKVRDRVAAASGFTFNFVLVNRYKDGNDYIGEHRDDEKDLVHGHPIASLSLGQPRDFVFKHAKTRGRNPTRKIAPVTVQLEHGSLLMMNHPTNTYWYHSLPQRKSLLGLRINMTFRKIDPSKITPAK